MMASTKPIATTSLLACFVCLAALVWIACASTTGDPDTSPPPPSPSSTSRTSLAYEVTDVRLVKTPDPVAQVVWSATFDARWTGEGEPERTRCRWQLLDQKEM